MLRQALVAALLAGFVVACLRLGWWQLQRYESPGGSLQNLGYTLQWPTFAVFAVVMWWRLRKLERTRRDAEPPVTNEPPIVDARPIADGPPTADEQLSDAGSSVTSKKPIMDAGEPDDELAAYNRYLAELNAAATRRAPQRAAQKERHRGR